MIKNQCRAARVWLGWTAKELATKAGVGEATVKRFEAGCDIRYSSADKMQRALERAGIEFEGRNGITFIERINALHPIHKKNPSKSCLVGGPILTPKEIAARHKRSLRWVQSMMEIGRIPSFWDGQRRVSTEAGYQEFVERLIDEDAER